MRQLVVSKCRYSDCSPGPHDAVLEDGAPAVWPFAPSFDFRIEQPLGFFMPMAIDNNRTRIVAFNRSGLILSLYDQDQQRVNRVWHLTPGLRQVEVHCGPTTIVSGPDGRSRTVPTSYGPSALLWVVQETTLSNNANAVKFTRLEHLLAKPRFSLTLPGLLNRLVRQGLMVMAHGTSSGLAQIDDIADFTGPKGHYIVSDVTTPQARDYRSASTWFAFLPSFIPGIDRPQRRPGAPDLASQAALLCEVQEKINSGELPAARDVLQQSIPGGNEPTSLRLRIEAAWLLHRIGMTRTALAHVQSAKSDDPAALAALGWVLAEMGDYENACRVALEAIDMDTVHPESARLWRALRAHFTTVPCQAEPTPLALRSWVETAAARANLDASDALLKNLASESRLSNNTLERLLADARMASPSSEYWQDAKARYEALLADEALAALDRADILFNLGVIHDRVGERDAAIAKLQDAIKVNPLHEPARDRLESFGVVAPAG